MATFWEIAARSVSNLFSITVHCFSITFLIAGLNTQQKQSVAVVGDPITITVDNCIQKFQFGRYIVGYTVGFFTAAHSGAVKVYTAIFLHK